MRQTASHEKVIDKLKILLSLLEISNIDKNVILTALNSNFKDFEDALQNFSAESSKLIELIITRNVKDYKNSKLGIMSPNDFINSKLYIN